MLPALRGAVMAQLLDCLLGVSPCGSRRCPWLGPMSLWLGISRITRWVGCKNPLSLTVDKERPLQNSPSCKIIKCCHPAARPWVPSTLPWRPGWSRVFTPSCPDPAEAGSGLGVSRGLSGSGQRAHLGPGPHPTFQEMTAPPFQVLQAQTLGSLDPPLVPHPIVGRRFCQPYP